MSEGKIIKFYREQAKLTQKQLGQGICSTTHISKIERGLTEYAPEIITLLAERLNINIDEEISHLASIKDKLDYWREMIVSQNMEGATKIKHELSSNPLIDVSNYYNFYLLIKLKHCIKFGHTTEAKQIMKQVFKVKDQLANDELNLYKHVLGIYYAMLNNHSQSLETLKSIDLEQYSNPLVYHDLSIAYFQNKSSVLAYYYAERALTLYKEKNNFLGIIDTESLMLIQFESDPQRDFKETIEKYESILVMCNLCNAADKKAKVLHNFAYEHFRRKHYHKAQHLYKQSLALKNKQTNYYLLSLEGFVSCSYEGQLLTQEELLKHVHEGLKMAKNMQDPLFTVIFKLHKYAILKREKQYYRYIEKKALPLLTAQGHVLLTQRYMKELLQYYSHNENTEEALKIATFLVDYATT